MTGPPTAGAEGREIGVFAMARTQSVRCPNKMLRPFAGTTLTDILLAKLAQVRYPSFFAGYEPVFRDRAEAAGVRFVQRDERSATIDEPILDILSFLRDVEFKHLLIVSGCLPFLRVETIDAFLDECVASGFAPAFGVVRRATHFVRLDGTPVNFELGLSTINTKTVQPLWEFAHALYFFNRRYFLEHGRYWDWRTVRYLEIANRMEVLDIDTEEDFALAEAIWRGLGGA